MSNVKFAARVTNYDEAAKFLGDAWSRKIGYATWVKRSTTNPHLISLIHHETAIITWDDYSGVAYMFTDGIVSRTTANRLNYFTPDRYRVSSRITRDEEWYIIEDVSYDAPKWLYSGGVLGPIWVDPSKRARV